MFIFGVLISLLGQKQEDRVLIVCVCVRFFVLSIEFPALICSWTLSSAAAPQAGTPRQIARSIFL